MAKKYIDAEKLTKAIEDKGLDCSFALKMERIDTLALIDSLQQEQPEQPTRGYDEAYLNDCIARAKKSWEGVDVDKFMDMVRGREPDSEELVEEVKRYYSDNYSYITGDQPTLSIVTNIARHFAKWGADHLRDSTKMVDKGLEQASEEQLKEE